MSHSADGRSENLGVHKVFCRKMFCFNTWQNLGVNFHSGATEMVCFRINQLDIFHKMAQGPTKNLNFCIKIDWFYKIKSQQI